MKQTKLFRDDQIDNFTRKYCSNYSSITQEQVQSLLAILQMATNATKEYKLPAISSLVDKSGQKLLDSQIDIDFLRAKEEYFNSTPQFSFAEYPCRADAHFKSVLGKRSFSKRFDNDRALDTLRCQYRNRDEGNNMILDQIVSLLVQQNQKQIKNDKIITVENVIDQILEEKPYKEPTCNMNLTQKQLQTMLYDQIYILQKLIKMGCQSSQTDIENQFTKQQQQYRKELFKVIQNGKHKRDKAILLSCQKNTKKLEDTGSEDYRGTDIRGVSKNGRYNWQILSMNEGQKVYLGTVDNILKAALLYDIFSIQVKGLKAKTNFNYSPRELDAVLQLSSLIKLKNSIKI